MGIFEGGLLGKYLNNSYENQKTANQTITSNAKTTSETPKNTTPAKATTETPKASNTESSDKGYTVTPLYQSTSGSKNTRTYRVTDNNTGKSTQTGYANIDAAGLIDYYEEKGQDVPDSLYAIAQYEADNKNTLGSQSGTYYDAFTGSGTLVDRTTGIKVQTTAPSQTVYLNETSEVPKAGDTQNTYTGQGMPTVRDLGNAIGVGIANIPGIGNLWNAAGGAVDTVINTHNSLYESDNLAGIGLGLAADIVLPLDLVKTAKKAADGEEVTGWDVFNTAVDIVGLIPGVGWLAKGAIKTAKTAVPAMGAVLNLTLNTDDVEDTPQTPNNPDTPTPQTPETPYNPETPGTDEDDGTSNLFAFLAGLIAGQNGSGSNSPGGGSSEPMEQYTVTEAKPDFTQYLPLIAVIGGVVLLGVVASRRET